MLEWNQLRYLWILAEFVSKAKERSMLVVLASGSPSVHSGSRSYEGGGFWYDRLTGEEDVIKSWEHIATLFCEEWNVIGVDLQNEVPSAQTRSVCSTHLCCCACICCLFSSFRPAVMQPHASSWGMGKETDWNTAAERIGNHVSARCPRWLILVEGVGDTPGARSRVSEFTGDTFYNGENLLGVRQAPILLNEPNKLVYSPHLFGPSVRTHAYYSDHHFPENLESVFQRHFGFVPEETGQPVLIGKNTYTIVMPLHCLPAEILAHDLANTLVPANYV